MRTNNRAPDADVKYFNTADFNDSSVRQMHLKVWKNGSVLIPAALRKALGMNPGEPLVVRWNRHEIRIVTLQRRVEEAQRRARKYVRPGVSLADELIADRRREAERE